MPLLYMLIQSYFICTKKTSIKSCKSSTTMHSMKKKWNGEFFQGGGGGG